MTDEDNHEHVHDENCEHSQPEISQELMFKLQMFEQQMQQIQQQIQAVEEGMSEMQKLDEGLGELVGKNGKEIFAPIGRGIFARAQLISEDLSVDVGGGNFVKKTIPETKEIISEQVKKLEQVKGELEQGLENLGKEFEGMIREEGEHRSVYPGNRNSGAKKEGKEETKKKIDELV